jgi:lipopolysaccharide export system permease protein
MRILDKYIVKNVGTSYIFILLVFIALYLVIDIFTNLSDVLKTKPPPAILTQYYLNSLPLIILRVSPLSLLIGTLYTFGELNKNNEIISMRSTGISVFRISFPIIFFAALVSISIFFLQEKILIYSQKKVEDIKLRFMQSDSARVSEERNLAFTSGDMIFFSALFSPKEKILKNVKIFEQDKNLNITKQVICKSIIHKDDLWIGKDIIEYTLDGNGNIVGMPLNYATKRIDLTEKPHELIFKKSIFSQFASLQNLKKEINSLKKIKTKETLANLTIDYYQKIADPFSHLFLVIGILPLALEIKKRKVALSSLGVGFIFGFIYYCFSSFSIALGKSGIILPFFSAWLAPLFFITVGLTGLSLID